MVTDISVMECLQEGWEYYKRHIWLALAAIICSYVILFGKNLISIFAPFWDVLFAFFVTPALSAGVYFLFLNIGRNSNPRFEDVFFGFKRYGTIIGLTFLSWAVMAIGMLPSIIIGWPILSSGFEYTDAIPNLGILMLILLNATILFFALYRFWLVYFVIVDEPRMGLIDSLRHSSQLTKGNGHNLILLALASVAIACLLTVLLIIPLLIFGPMLGVAMARFYLKVKEMHDKPAVVAPEGPVVIS